MNPVRLLLCLLIVGTAPRSNAQLADPEGLNARATRQTSAQTALPVSDAPAYATLTYVITDAPNSTFGYDILSNGKLFVRQTNIPGQPGTSGCATRGDAERLAQFVIDKIQRGVLPPTVTKVELTSLGLL